MKTAKQERRGSVRILSTDSTDNPKLGAKTLADGRESLFLDFYLGYDIVVDEETGKKTTSKRRERQSLKLYLIKDPRTPQDRQQNREVLELAKQIRFEREQELLEDREGYRLKKHTKIDFLQYYKEYMEVYCRKDRRVIRLAYGRFIDFLNDTPDYRRYRRGLPIEDLSREMMIDFTDYLQSRSKGEGANTLFKRFKKVVKYAIDHKIIPVDKDPCRGISIAVDENTITKEILSPEEIIQLLRTNNKEQNQDVRRAFIFCLYTGMRFCDVSELRYTSVDFSNKILRYTQRKTEGHSARAGVTIPLNEGILSIIGKEPEEADKDSLIFNLPSYWMCSKSLKRWVKNAGINKNITWHCARHSFATNLVANGVDIVTTSNLMGHSSLQYTEKYTRAMDKLKTKAINSLPEIK